MPWKIINLQIPQNPLHLQECPTSPYQEVIPPLACRQCKVVSQIRRYMAFNIDLSFPYSYTKSKLQQKPDEVMLGLIRGNLLYLKGTIRPIQHVSAGARRLHTSLDTDSA